MKKVIHILDSLEISGGVQAVVMNTYRAMDKSLVTFDFAVYECPENNSYRQEIEKLGGHIFIIGGIGKAGIFEFIKRISEVFQSGKYDAVHAHNLHHNGIILRQAKKANIPIRISHCHQSFDERNQSFLRKLYVKGLEFLLYHSATQLVACSDKAAKYLYGNRKYTFLPNSINLAPYSRQHDSQRLKQMLDIPCSAKVILLIGRFSPPKNHLFALEIMNELHDKGNYILLLVGSGELLDSLKSRITQTKFEKAVRFLGLRKDIPQLLSLADVAILPSIHEGLPMVAIEAQAAACPILISDVVTRQADLGVGLVKYLPLHVPDWTREIQIVCNEPPEKPAQDIIMNKLRETGFESSSNLKRWYGLYGIGENVNEPEYQ